ncbi:MAG: OB-fold nucleic acid binding domain-containing protein, partial [Gemmatimonadota bacterium]|nr:OB-fold nucleic acid binding domain-containing protein [Gemmatimonadota bacterium]
MTERRTDATGWRSRGLGTVTIEQAGEELRLCGWVHRRRDLGGLVFLDLRDRSGILQASVGPDWSDELAVASAGG